MGKTQYTWSGSHLDNITLEVVSKIIIITVFT